jgi:transposase
MDIPGEIRMPVKRRRRHTPRFKAQVLAEAVQPGASVAAIAQHHNLNANLIHKWRRAAECGLTVTPAFIPLPVTPARSQATLPEVRLEISGARGSLNVFWPCDQPQSLAEFLKTLS